MKCSAFPCGSVRWSIRVSVSLLTLLAKTLLRNKNVPLPSVLPPVDGHLFFFFQLFISWTRLYSFHVRSYSSSATHGTTPCGFNPFPFLFPLQFFHFALKAFLPAEGQFNGRIRWQGSPARGEASLVLINATLSDNGTYTCSVRNPPDVHGSPMSHTVLTVTPKGKSRLWLITS